MQVRHEKNKGDEVMNIQQLRCAIEVWRCGSISKAAERLYMNQPNLSRVIKSLEEEFNLTIFSRTASGVEITHEGESFLTEAERIVDQSDEFESAFKSGCGDRLAFRIAVPRVTYIAQAFADAVALCGTENSMDIGYRETNNQSIINCVASLGYDMGIIRFPVEFESAYKKQLAEKRLKYQELLTFRHVAVMSRSHPLANRKRLRLTELANYTALIHGDNHSVEFSDHSTDQLYKTQLYKKTITIYERGSQFDFLRSIPGTFMLVSPLPESELTANSLVQIDLEKRDIGMFEDVIITRHNRRATEFEQTFMNCLLETEHKVMGLPEL